MRIATAGILIGALTQGAPAQFDPNNPIPDPIPHNGLRVRLQPIARGLTGPNLLTHAHDGSGRRFIVEQTGTVRVVDASGDVLAAPFLDVSSRLVDLGLGIDPDPRFDFDERGFLGLAFHPDYATPGAAGFGKVYTYTSEPVSGPADFTTTVPIPAMNHQSVISEWTVGASDPNRVDPASRRELMRIDEPQFNHNSGNLAFGPDGLLYATIGDGGGSNDDDPGHSPQGNSQDTTNILGSMIRIDPTGATGALSANGQYSIPSDNPFAGSTTDVNEIYAFGLRNAFRFSFDRATDELYIADVGQRQIEEINLGALGANYGWRLKEGTFAFDPATGTISDDLTGLPAGLTDPIAQYDHDEGISIIGGFVYRGTLMPELEGMYIFGDFSTSFSDGDGRLFALDLTTMQIEEILIGDLGLPLDLYIKGFGEDEAGEIYLLADQYLGFGNRATAFRLVPAPGVAGALALGGLAAARRRRA